MTPHCHIHGNPSPTSLPYGPIPPLFTVTSQGRLLTVKYRGRGKPPVKTVGSTCQGFGRASRMAQIAFLNTLDIPKCEPCLFITLTIPDAKLQEADEKLVQWRSDFWRRMEARVGNTATMWRIEFKPRLTGLYPGVLFPHYHFMVLNCKFICMNYVNAQWGKVIGWKQYVRTETKGMENWQQTCYYVSKYLAKLEDRVGSLVIGVNLNKGKKWGVLRKELVPICSTSRWASNEPALANEVRLYGKECWKGTPDENGVGFRVFGHDAATLGKILDG